MTDEIRNLIQSSLDARQQQREYAAELQRRGLSIQREQRHRESMPSAIQKIKDLAATYELSKRKYEDTGAKFWCTSILVAERNLRNKRYTVWMQLSSYERLRREFPEAWALVANEFGKFMELPSYNVTESKQ